MSNHNYVKIRIHAHGEYCVGSPLEKQLSRCEHLDSRSIGAYGGVPVCSLFRTNLKQASGMAFGRILRCEECNKSGGVQ